MPPVTDDLGQWAAIVGIVLPFLVALLQKASWGDPQRTKMINSGIFAAAVVVASIIYAAIKYSGDFSWARWEEVLLAMLVWGIATYHTFWNRSGYIEAARANFKKGSTGAK